MPVCLFLRDDIGRERFQQFREVDFVPFGLRRGTEATIERLDNRTVFRVTKGAPLVILNECQCNNAERLQSHVQSAVQELGDRGFRSLGVAVVDWQSHALVRVTDSDSDKF